MKVTKRITSLLSVMLILVITCTISANSFEFTPTAGVDENGKGIPLELYSESVYMVDLNTGETIVNIKGEEARVPASLTKIMTAVVLLDKFKANSEKLKTTYVSCGSEAFDELYDTGASTADIQPNEKVSYYNLLAALLIPSSCEAANIIAINIGGSVQKFCDLMNKKAEELKMKDTHFSNAHGLFANKNYTSCKDMTILCRYALDNFPEFKEIVAMPEYNMEATDYHPSGTTINNTNYMLEADSDYYYANVKGIKTGTLEEAGRCLASYASYDGNNYMIVSMGAPIEKREQDIKLGEDNPDSVFADDVVYYNCLDHIALYKWAFNNLAVTDFINTSSEVQEASIEFGKGTDYVTLKPANGYSRLWPTDIPVEDVKQEITVKKNIVAPVEEGDVLGELQLVYKGEVLSSIDLVANGSVERDQFSATLYVAKSFFKSSAFIIAIAVIILILLVYSLIHAIRTHMKYIKK
ncbi:MAG: D-alanyl-D-alanine carboxypeptidase [Ruminococcus sp.]|nr:D-alanyl-D-alanine carboxypeptidase [Ruminococcus sp.]